MSQTKKRHFFNKDVIIIGASPGIGRAMARHFTAKVIMLLYLPGTLAANKKLPE